MAAKKKAASKKEASKGGSKKTKERPVDIELTKELVRYDFSRDDLIELGEELIELVGRRTRLKEEKKSAAKSFDSEINKLELIERETIDKMSNKFEMVTMPCLCVRDYKDGTVYYFREDQVSAEAMRAHGSKIFDLIKAGELAADPVKMRDLKAWERQRELDMQMPDENEQSGEGDQIPDGSETVTTDEQ